jgi:nickel/cobalt transporter (NicO) family protein
MGDLSGWVLPSAAAAAGAMHTLIPDHWLPFVLIARARGWDPLRVAWLSGLSALIHTGLSIGLGLSALALGLGAAERMGQTLARIGPGLLIAFGLLYAGWAWRKGGHFHPGGRWLHRRGLAACAGEEGPGNPEHLHYHADQELIRGGLSWSGVGLALIIGLNPCVLIFPLIVAAAPHGSGAVALVVLAYSVPTVSLMVGLSTLGARLGWAVGLPGAVRHAEAASGLLIALVGLLFAVLD